MANDYVEHITPQDEDFSQWYLDVIQKADLMDYAPVRGCIVFKPDGYELWERCQAGLDKRFKETGHRNAYFPLLIPRSYMEREADHVEGFNPEVPWVTHVADKELEEPLAIRPTSETMIGAMYSKWIQSYRDLPLLLNQWVNVMRWEKRTYPFLRTSEFLWQEGHTAHANEQEAREETMRMLNIYIDFVENEMAIPVVAGEKTPRERFAGAVQTFTIETMMRDGKALQAGTSHYLGQNFAKAFDIQFLNEENEREYVYTTSWGASTRLLGALIMVHGDNRGLQLPPRIAPRQVVIVPITPGDTRSEVLEAAARVEASLVDAGLRVFTDDRANVRPGWKFNEYELRGIPVRLEIGPRDIENDQVVLVRRDTGEKETVSTGQAAARLQELMAEIQDSLFERATSYLEEHSSRASSTTELEEQLQAKPGFVLASWCGNDACEEAIQSQTGATARNIPFDQPGEPGPCLECGEPGSKWVWYAKAY